MSYAEIVLATVPAALPTEKNQRATSWPPPISANVPYARASRLSASAFCRVVGVFTLVAQTETPPAYRYVSVEGPVTSVRPATLDGDRRPMARRYLGVELGDRFVESGA